MEIQWFFFSERIEKIAKRQKLHRMNWENLSTFTERLHNLLFISILYKQKQINLFKLDRDSKFYGAFGYFSLCMFNRNRLESNSEHWNALLLSLRELTEWVIRKDTELSQLRSGPLRGDAASLQKQLVSFSILKVIQTDPDIQENTYHFKSIPINLTIENGLVWDVLWSTANLNEMVHKWWNKGSIHQSFNNEAITKLIGNKRSRLIANPFENLPFHNINYNLIRLDN